jgi:hypothetical protein
MELEDLPLLGRILIGVLAPLLLTLICWVAGPRLAGPRRKRTQARSWVEFCLMLVASYVMFAVAVWGGRYLATRERADPSSEVFQ